MYEEPEPAPDIFAAGYQGMNEDMMEDDMEGDPYAAIEIDPTKIVKPVAPAPEEKKSSAESSEYRESESESDVNRGRVEDNHEESSEAAESKGRVVNFEELNKINEESRSEPYSPSKKEESKVDTSKKEDAYDSDTFISNHETSLEKPKDSSKNAIKEPGSNAVELSGDNMYSYEDDFEASSVPMTSNEQRAANKVKLSADRVSEKDNEVISSHHRASQGKEKSEDEIVRTVQGRTQVVEVVKRVTVEHKSIQTDLGPVKFADKSTRECLLEAMVLDEKKKTAAIGEEVKEREAVIKRLQENLKKLEKNCVGAQRTAGSSEATAKKLKADKENLLNQIESLKDERQELNHKLSDLSTELAELQSMNVRIQDECERRVRAAEDHAETQARKVESRAMQELQHNFAVEKAVLRKEVEDRETELDYYREKLVKMEAENSRLAVLERNQGAAERKLREAEDKNCELKAKLETLAKTSAENPFGGSEKSLEHEVKTQEALIKGYQKENENMTLEIQALKNKLKDMEAMMYKENVRLRKEQNNMIKSTDKIMITENKGNLHLETMNEIGKSNVITRGELRNLKLQIEVLEADKKRLEEQLATSDKQTQGQIAMLIRQREDLEERAGMKYEDVLKERQDKERLVADVQSERRRHSEEVEGLQGRVRALVENQKVMEKSIEFLKHKDEEIKLLKKKVKELTAMCKASKEEASEADKLKKQIEELKKQQKQGEKEHAAKMKTLRQLYERARSKQEALAKNVADTAKPTKQPKKPSKPLPPTKQKPTKGSPVKENSTEDLPSKLHALKLAIQAENQNDINNLIEQLKPLLKTKEEFNNLVDEATPVLDNKENVIKIVEEMERGLTRVEENCEEAQDDAELCTYATQELQKWLPISGLTNEFLQRAYDPGNSGLIAAEDFVQGLQALNCPLDIENVHVWMRKLNFDADGRINYVTLLEDLGSRSIEWWADFIKNYKQKKTMPKNLSSFIHSSIIAKINYYLKPEAIEQAKKVLEDCDEEELDERGLHRVIQDMNCPLNSEDTAFMMDYIGHGGLVSKESVGEFLFKSPLAGVREAWGELPVPSMPPHEEKFAGGSLRAAAPKNNDKWEAKARTLYAKYKEANNNLESMKQHNRDLQSKLKTIYRDPKYAQIVSLHRKIDTLEEVIRERDVYIRKTLGGANEAEMATLRQNAETEKAELLKTIEDKDGEILMFKKELDSVLVAMERMKAKTGY